MKKRRPLSPHLQIYRWRWTMVFSILHRFTGVILTVGMFYLCIKLAAFAFGGQKMFEHFFHAGKLPVFKIMKLIFAWSLLYHTCQGIRHLIWDTGKLFALRHGRIGGYVSFSVATVLFVYYLPLLGGYRIF